jgi:cysteine-rich repeat protein
MRACTFTVLLVAMLAAVGCSDSSNNASGACGNGKLDGNEECDDGNTVDGDGCDATCKFSCVSTDSARDCAGDDECTASTCNDASHTCTPVTAVADNQPCEGGANYCLSGVCTAAVCGNGKVEPGEDCEGTGSCNHCKFVCTDAPATQCASTPPVCQTYACGAGNTCVTVADAAADGAACDPAHAGNVCVAGTCQAPACGDGVREAGEQCDDGNTLNLDGCDSSCQFEESQRVTSLQQQFASDAFCPTNALGEAITPDAQSTIQATWDVPVSDGTLSIVFKFLGLQSLTGGDTPFTLGFVKARAGGRTLLPSGVDPVCGNGVCEESPDPGLSENASDYALQTDAGSYCPDDCTYDGMSDLDWWYVRDPASVDATETPKQQLSGQIRSGLLTAGPGTVTISLLFAFQPSDVMLFDTRVEAAVDGAVTAPTLATGAAPPGHLASEHLSPSLTSVEGSTTGSLCSQVSAASLFHTPIPTVLQGTCTERTDPDDPNTDHPVFTSANTLLDVFVAGCAVFDTPSVTPTQPDSARDGATYHLDIDDTRTVTSCTRNGVPAVLDDCLAQATYSSYFKFAADRVILKRE